MQIVKSIRISLTMDDIIDNVSLLTKQQIVQKFRLLLDRKEIQINQKIQKNNAQHLLILQKKMLLVQKKDDQIVKLNNTLSSYKNQLNQERSKNNDLTDELIQAKMKSTHFEKKFNQFDSIYKDQKGKKQKFKKQLQKLQLQYKLLVDQHQDETRNHKKVKEQKTLWQQQTEMLLNNLKRTSDVQSEYKIKNIRVQYQNKIAELEQILYDQKKKHESYKDKYLQAKNSITTLNKAIQLLNKQIVNEKTRQKRQKQKEKQNIKIMVEAQSQTGIELLESAFLLGKLFKKQFLASMMRQKNPSPELRQIKQLMLQSHQTQTQQQGQQCQKCKQLKTVIQNLQNQIKILKPTKKKVQKARFNTIGSQTNQIPKPILTESECQTVFKALQKQQQQKLIEAFRIINETSSKMINSSKKKYQEIQTLFLNRPSKLQDRERINQLEKNLVTQEIITMEKQREIQSKQVLISELYKKIQEQGVILSQVTMQEMEIKSLNRSLDKRPSTVEQFARNFANGIRSQLCNRGSRINRTQTRRSQTNQIKSSSLNASHRNNTMNLSSQSIKLRTEANNESPPKQQSQQKQKQRQKKTISIKIVKKQNYSKNNEEVAGYLLQRGIVFKNKDKDKNTITIGTDQMSQLRQYKKYKGSLKKVNL